MSPFTLTVALKFSARLPADRLGSRSRWRHVTFRQEKSTVHVHDKPPTKLGQQLPGCFGHAWHLSSCSSKTYGVSDEKVLAPVLLGWCGKQELISQDRSTDFWLNVFFVCFLRMCTVWMADSSCQVMVSGGFRLYTAVKEGLKETSLSMNNSFFRLWILVNAVLNWICLVTQDF